MEPVEGKPRWKVACPGDSFIRGTTCVWTSAPTPQVCVTWGHVQGVLAHAAGRPRGCSHPGRLLICCSLVGLRCEPSRRKGWRWGTQGTVGTVVHATLNEFAACKWSASCLDLDARHLSLSQCILEGLRSVWATHCPHPCRVSSWLGARGFLLPFRLL